jgi:hypothetical protein
MMLQRLDLLRRSGKRSGSGLTTPDRFKYHDLRSVL